MRQHRRWALEAALGVALLAGILVGAARQLDEGWHDKLIRLHVVAHSDDPADQAQKLEVRDAVLAETDRLLTEATDTETARAQLAAHLTELETAANDALAGTGRSAQVTLQRETFPLREYETFTLPAGEYEALRVTIGAGKGHNWWCVVYPSLCFTASAEDVEACAVAAGLTEAEAAQLTHQPEGYVFRFRLVELWEQLLSWLRSRST